MEDGEAAKVTPAIPSKGKQEQKHKLKIQEAKARLSAKLQPLGRVRKGPSWKALHQSYLRKSPDSELTIPGSHSLVVEVSFKKPTGNGSRQAAASISCNTLLSWWLALPSLKNAPRPRAGCLNMIFLRLAETQGMEKKMESTIPLGVTWGLL